MSAWNRFLTAQGGLSSAAPSYSQRLARRIIAFKFRSNRSIPPLVPYLLIRNLAPLARLISPNGRPKGFLRMTSERIGAQSFGTGDYRRATEPGPVAGPGAGKDKSGR